MQRCNMSSFTSTKQASCQKSCAPVTRIVIILREAPARAVRAAAALSLIVCAACAQLPSQSNVKAFGQAASSASTLFTQALTVNSELAQRSGENQAVVKFLSGCSPPPCDNLAPNDLPHLAKEALQPRIDLIAAIGKYAQALSTASDPQTIKDLKASATTLVSTVGGDLAPLVGGAAVPLVGPIAQSIGEGVELAVTAQQSAAIQEVMRATHPSLVAATNELKASLAIIRRNNKDQLEVWKASEITVLSAVRDDPLVSKATAEAEFRAAVTDARALEAKLVAIDAFNNVLDAMVKAHASLIEANSGSNADLSDFLAVVNQLQGILAVIKPSR